MTGEEKVSLESGRLKVGDTNEQDISDGKGQEDGVTRRWRSTTLTAQCSGVGVLIV